MIALVVYLGNPGSQYMLTRHNAAWLCLSRNDSARSLRWQRKFKGEYAEHRIEGQKIYLHKPLGYMNKSGESIAAIAGFYRVKPENILVIHDEVELQLGEIGLKYGGGLSGHNGLRSTAGILGTKDFYRLRIGIGRPDRGPVSSHVLGRFRDGELEELDDVAVAVENLIGMLVADSIHPSPLLDRYRRCLVRNMGI